MLVFPKTPEILTLQLRNDEDTSSRPDETDLKIWQSGRLIILFRLIVVCRHFLRLKRPINLGRTKRVGSKAFREKHEIPPGCCHHDSSDVSGNCFYVSRRAEWTAARTQRELWPARGNKGGGRVKCHLSFNLLVDKKKQTRWDIKRVFRSPERRWLTASGKQVTDLKKKTSWGIKRTRSSLSSVERLDKRPVTFTSSWRRQTWESLYRGSSDTSVEKQTAPWRQHQHSA